MAKAVSGGSITVFFGADGKVQEIGGNIHGADGDYKCTCAIDITNTADWQKAVDGVFAAAKAGVEQ